jgi:hypothetical protein
MTQGHYVTRGAIAPVEPQDAEPPGRLLIRSRSEGLADEEAVGNLIIQLEGGVSEAAGASAAQFGVDRAD